MRVFVWNELEDSNLSSCLKIFLDLHCGETCTNKIGKCI
jgi:hypothetical protein